MLVRCWGTRGSIPVSGPEFLKYGGDTTCLEIRTRSGEVVIVDAGSGIRRLGNLLVKEQLWRYALVFTHSHWDHLAGFPFFKPIYHDGAHIDVYGCSFAQESVRSMLSKTMRPPHFPVNFSDLRAELRYFGICGEPFRIGALEVSSIPLSHPNQGVGLRFTEGGRSVVFLTDNELGHCHPGGLGFREYRDFAQGADLLIHDAEFTPQEYRRVRTWGHSTYTDALRLAMDAGVSRFWLTHHNQERTDAQVDAMVAQCRAAITNAGVSLECDAATYTTELEL